MKKESNVVDYYIQNVISKSWTWERLTNAEKDRFLSMDVFNRIKGRDEQRVEWLNTIYHSYLVALGYNWDDWRESKDECLPF